MLMELWRITIADGDILVRAHNSVTKESQAALGTTMGIIDRAMVVSGYKGDVVVRHCEQEDADTNAVTTWPMMCVPFVTLYPSAFSEGLDNAGITLSHELVHCRQGMWRVFLENLWWALMKKSGFPPIELEAMEVVNRW